MYGQFKVTVPAWVNVASHARIDIYAFENISLAFLAVFFFSSPYEHLASSLHSGSALLRPSKHFWAKHGLDSVLHEDVIKKHCGGSAYLLGLGWSMVRILDFWVDVDNICISIFNGLWTVVVWMCWERLALPLWGAGDNMWQLRALSRFQRFGEWTKVKWKPSFSTGMEKELQVP